MSEEHRLSEAQANNLIEDHTQYDLVENEVRMHKTVAARHKRDMRQARAGRHTQTEDTRRQTHIGMLEGHEGIESECH